jgi:hypothetical protein
VARKVLTLLRDDVDGSKATETITFGLDGITYQIDLNTKHANKLRKTLAPFVAAGRRVGSRSRPARSVKLVPPARPRGATRVTPAETPVDPATVRAWAAANRIPVSPRGRIPADVVAQFRAAGN